MYDSMILNQDMGFPRPKYIVLEGLKKKITELGDRLRVSFDVTLEYPRRETQQHSATGASTITRRIVIKKLTSSPVLQGIGQVYTADTFQLGQDILKTVEAEGIGQLDNHTIEISAWATDSKARDAMIDLIKVWMLELNQKVEDNDSTGLPFFFQRGVFSSQEVRNYESIDRSDAQTPYFVGIIVYNLMTPFYGTRLETMERYKFNIINSLVDGTDPTLPPTLPGDITIQIPTTGNGPIGGGGGGSTIGDTPASETYQPPKSEKIRPYSGTTDQSDLVYIPNPSPGSGKPNDIIGIKD